MGPHGDPNSLSPRLQNSESRSLKVLVAPRSKLLRRLRRGLSRSVPLLTLAFLVCPLGVTILGSLTSAWQRSLFEPWTLAWYRYVFDHYMQALALSLDPEMGHAGARQPV